MNIRKIAALYFVIAISTTVFSQDWRQVGEGRVDLGPLHEWMANGKAKKGDRPLPHWQRIYVQDFKKQLATYHQCTIRLEDGTVTEVFIAHIEPSVKTIYSEIVRIREKAAKIQAEIDTANAELDDANRRIRKNRNSQLKQFRKNLADLNQDEKSALKKLEGSKEGGMFAMNTGKTYAGFPIWDCGVKVAAPVQTP